MQHYEPSAWQHPQGISDQELRFAATAMRGTKHPLTGTQLDRARQYFLTSYLWQQMKSNS
jgi:hypothetical protein